MKRRCLLLFALLGTLSTGFARANDLEEFYHACHRDYQRSNIWPHPFREPVVFQTRAPFEVMTSNGWRAHNTIGDELFRSGDQVLNEAGMNRLSWIVSQAPVQRRVVFVLQGASAEETEARVTAVRRSIGSMYLTGPQPHVMVTDIRPGVSSGAWHTQLNRSRLSSQPAPLLPPREHGTTD